MTTDITNEHSSADLVDRNAVDRSGDKIGRVVDVYVDDQTGQPEWLAISTGLFGTKVSFAPLTGAEMSGDDVLVPYEKSLVKDAPRAEADGHLSAEEERALYAHYGRSWDATAAGDARDRDLTDRRTGTAGVGTTGTDDAMTRSEEELEVRTSRQETGRARLRKWVETEDVHITVPVKREKARLVTEPITDANRGDAMSGADLTTDEHEVVLSEEVVDVDKHVTPKERVRLETEVETDQVAVDEQVRKERIGMDEDVDTRRRS